MKILFDQGTPAPLRRYLAGHSVDTAYERGWSDLRNGDLLKEAEINGYELLITTDQNMRYQQNLVGKSLGILVLLSTSWPRIQPRIGDVQDIVDGMQPGDYRELPILCISHLTQRLIGLVTIQKRGCLDCLYALRITPYPSPGQASSMISGSTTAPRAPGRNRPVTT